MLITHLLVLVDRFEQPYALLFLPLEVAADGIMRAT